VTPKQREIAVHTISKALFIGANYKFGDGDVTHCFKEADKTKNTHEFIHVIPPHTAHLAIESTDIQALHKIQCFASKIA